MTRASRTDCGRSCHRLITNANPGSNWTTSLDVSGWLVQALVQAAGGVDVSPLSLQVAAVIPEIVDLGVAGSSPVSHPRSSPLTRDVSGLFLLGQAATIRRAFHRPPFSISTAMSDNMPRTRK